MADQKPLRLRDEIPKDRFDPLFWLKWMRRRGFTFWVYIGLGGVSLAVILAIFIPVARTQGQLDFRAPPDVSLSIASPTTAAAGSDYTYVLSYDNIGPSPAGSVAVNIRLPDEVIFKRSVPGSPACVLAGGPDVGFLVAAAAENELLGTPGGFVKCRLGTRQPGQLGNIELNVDIGDLAQGASFTLTADVVVGVTRDLKKEETITDNNSIAHTITIQ